MTHTKSRRFRLGWLAVPAVAALALGVPASAAFAGQTPGPSQASSYMRHHHAPRHCEFIELSGHAIDNDRQGQDTGGYAAPQNEQGKGQDRARAEVVEAFQLVKVCEVNEHLTIVDVTRPFVEETEPPQVNPYPDQAPSPSDYVTPAATG